MDFTDDEIESILIEARGKKAKLGNLIKMFEVPSDRKAKEAAMKLNVLYKDVGTLTAVPEAEIKQKEEQKKN